MADFDDEVPPLEDMNGLIEQVHKINGNEKSSSEKSNPPATRSQPQTNEVLVTPQQESGTVSSGNRVTKKHNAAPKQSNSSFAGMKKGFLFDSSSKPKPAKKTSAERSSTPSSDSTTDIPLIRPKTEGRKNEITEVQDALKAGLKASTPLLQSTEWVTEDLFKKLEQSPKLLQQLSDPRITQAMAKFQKNPQLAMQEYQSSPEIQQFFKDFCGILGQHFDSLGASNSQSPQSPSPQTIRTNDNTKGADMSVHSSTNPNQATAADDARMKEILTDPKVQEVLMDREIQRLFAVLKSNPDEAQRMMQQLGAQGKEKVQRLVDAGLLGFSSR